MRTRHRRDPRTSNRRGAVIIEFTLVFMLFLALAVAAFEFSRATWAHSTVAHAAKTAARYAMMHGANNMEAPSTPGQSPQEATEAEVIRIAKADAVGLEAESLTVKVSYSPDNQPGSQVAVSVLYPFRFVAAPLLGVAKGVPIARTSAMTVVN